MKKTIRVIFMLIAVSWGFEELEKNLPFGWEVKPFDSEFNVSTGRTPPRNLLKWFCSSDAAVKCLSIKDIGLNGCYVLQTNVSLTEDAILKFKIPVILENTTIVSFK